MIHAMIEQRNFGHIALIYLAMQTLDALIQGKERNLFALKISSFIPYLAKCIEHQIGY